MKPRIVRYQDNPNRQARERIHSHRGTPQSDVILVIRFCRANGSSCFRDLPNAIYIDHRVTLLRV